MLPEISIYAGGILTIIMALIHTRFFKMFSWETEFKNLSPANSKILYTIHLALLLLFFAIGALLLSNAEEIGASTGLSAWINSLMFLFWFWRLIWQFMYFKRKKDQKRPLISLLMSALFGLLCASHFVPLLYRLI